MSLRGAILVLSRPRLVQMRVFDLFLLDDLDNGSKEFMVSFMKRGKEKKHEAWEMGLTLRIFSYCISLLGIPKDEVFLTTTR